MGAVLRGAPLSGRVQVESDGGTLVVPGFHRVFERWRAALGTWHANRVGQRRRGCSFMCARRALVLAGRAPLFFCTRDLLQLLLRLCGADEEEAAPLRA